ncbi:MAG: hypothetical protein F6K47_41830, partial [Symploca sp. SIO2E6]|nr:hypothetical protein [Symploca sp. SIO2E6]
TRLIPFIFLTAKSQLNDLRKGMELGADDYLTKPVSPPSLFNSIARRLEKRENQKKEIKQLKEELSLELAVSIPPEVEASISRIATLGNLINLKFGQEDRQSVEICDSLSSEIVSLKRSIRRINLFGRLPKLYSNRFNDAMLEQGPGSSRSLAAADTAAELAIRCDRNEDLEVSVQDHVLDINPQYLEILVEELLANAIQASESGQKISLDLSLEDDMLCISVSDSGCGIEEDTLEDLLSFSKFGQLNSQSQKVSLGLPLVQGITRLHGGEFCLEPNPDGGTIATVFLPHETSAREES